MRALLVLVVASLLTSPALAANCYVNTDGDRLSFLDAGAEPNTQITKTDGAVVMCDWMSSAESTGTRIDCDDGVEGFGSFGSYPPGGTSRDLLSYRDMIWYNEAC